MSGEILKLALVNILNFEFCPDADVWLKFLSSLYETFIERSCEQLKIAKQFKTIFKLALAAWFRF